MARLLAKILTHDVIQSVASSTVYSTFKTGIEQRDNIGLLIKRVEFEIPANLWKNTGGVQMEFRAAIFRGIHSAWLGLESKSTVAYWAESGTTTFTKLACTYVWDAPSNFVIANEDLTLGFTSAGFGAILGINCRIFCQNTNLTPGQIIQLRAM